jgi:VanZ family protein
MVMIFGFSSLSTPPAPPEGFSYYDVHTGVYAGLGFLTARAWGKGLRSMSLGAVLGAAVISILYGVSDEFHQRFVPGRTFDVFDMLADAIGSVLGATAAGAWSIISRRL